MHTLAIILASVALSGVGQLCLKLGSRAGSPLWSVPTVGGLLLWGASTLLWLWVLRRAPLSYAYCIGSLNYIVVPLLAHRLFHEPLSTPRLLGMALIALGVALTIYGNLQPAAR